MNELLLPLQRKGDVPIDDLTRGDDDLSVGEGEYRYRSVLL